MEFGNYAKEQKKEEETFDNTVDYIRKVTNKRPYIEKVELDEKSNTNIKIKALAFDDDKEKLTYILYIGNNKEDLSEVYRLEEMEEQEVTLTVTGDFSQSKYFKIDVKDEFVIVEGKIMPLAKVEIGSYVDYKPANGTFKMTDIEPSTEETYISLSGYDPKTSGYYVQETEFTTDAWLQWRIWDINEEKDKLVLIADGVTEKQLYLQGAPRI
ncbi:MAG: hypothetical protein HFJ54_06205 [Clostridia bacterium]|nr:hypothetical protein [Clostridia bacterium]